MVQITTCQTRSKPNLTLFPHPNPVKAWKCWAIPMGITKTQPNHLATWYHTGKKEGQERNMCVADSNDTWQKTHLTPLTGSGTPLLRRLLLEGILSRRSCHEKTITLDGPQDFQTLETAFKTHPWGIPETVRPLRRDEYADLTEYRPSVLSVQDNTSAPHNHRSSSRNH